MTSLFRKTLMVYMSVVILAFSGLAVGFTLEIKHFLAQQRLTVLNREAQEILPFLDAGNSNKSLNPVFWQLVSHDKLVDNTTVNVLFADNGTHFTNVQALTNQLISHNQIRNANAVKRVLAGHRIQFIGPFRTIDREATLTVGFPIQQNGHTIGALFLHTAVRELQLGQVIRILFFIVAPILLLSILILYIVTKRFAMPLTRITQAIASFGAGQFWERIPVESHDEIGQLADTFNHMASQLDRLENMRKDLIANVSHELRTPLTSVRGFIQGMLEGVIPERDYPKYLATCYKEMHRLNAILNAMLDLSAIETGHAQLNMTQVTWPEVVHSVRDSVHVRLEEKHLEWRETCSPTPMVVWGDFERLQQVLFNLLDNAIRHTAAGNISISSTVENQQLLVHVSDSGEGIPPEVLPHIWERFYTGQNQPAKIHQQTGLGLTITRHLVQLMNGRIEVQSQLDKGTTFTLRFPTLDTTHEQ